jgi:hypothetical protein
MNLGAEHEKLPQYDTAIYDVIVTQVCKVAPGVKFVGMASDPSAHLTHLGIAVIDEAELIDYAGQCPRTRVVDCATGKPNARFWVLKAHRENFSPSIN